MEKQGFFKRVIFPIAVVMGVMILSINLYDFSRSIENREFIAHLSAVMMFLSIWMGALFCNTMAYFRGASFGERLFVSLATPLVWSAKILYGFLGIYSFGEFLFLIFHNLILGCPVVALLCMGLSELFCRTISKKREKIKTVKIFSKGNVTVLSVGVILTVLMLWNGGHDYYYLYMDVYTYLFL